MSELTELVGANVRTARLANGLSQQGLAKRADVSRLGIVYLESGKFDSVKTGTLQKLAAALGVSVRDLLPDVGSR